MRTILSSSRQRLPVSNRNSSNQNLQHHSDSDSGQSSADSVSGQITASNNEGNPVRNEIGWRFKMFLYFRLSKLAKFGSTQF